MNREDPGFGLLAAGAAACGVALFLAGLTLLVWRLRRSPPAASAFPAAALLAGCVALAAPALGARTDVARAALVLAVAACALAAPVDARHVPRPRAASVAAAAALAAAATLLALRLWDPSLETQQLFTWERVVAAEIEQDLARVPTLTTALLTRLTWQLGLLSTGGDSLLYGFPVFVLFAKAHASILLLRLPAALLALASLALAWRVARRFHGPAAGALAAFAWLLSPVFLAYSFYGTSVTATWVGVWLAIGALLRVLARPTVPGALLFLAALYLATLAYAPGRVAATALLLAAVPALLWRGGPRGALRAAATLVAGAALLTVANARTKSLAYFYAARGEGLLGMQSQEAAPFLRRALPNGPLAQAERLELAFALVRTTAPAFAAHVFPVDSLAPENVRRSAADPLHVPLVLAPALPLVLWGLFRSFRDPDVSRRAALSLVAAFLLTSGPLLLTNRVDSGRVAVLLPFLTLWAGLGAADFAARLSRAAPAPVAAALAAVLAAGLAVEAHAIGLDAPTPPAPVAASLLGEIRRTSAPVRIANWNENADGAWLEALARLREAPGLLPAQVRSDYVERLADAPAPSPDAVEIAARLARQAPLLLVPAHAFKVLERDAAAYGLRVSVVGVASQPVLRIEAGSPEARAR